MASQRRTTAIHEAGHAVASCRVGLGARSVSIIPRDNTLGRAGGGQDPDLTLHAAKQQLISALAGYAALAAIGAPDATDGCESDFEEAQDLLDFWRLAGTLDKWKAKAVKLMRRPENIKAVDFVAERLEADGQLDDDLVEVLIDVADGTSTHADLEEYEVRRRAALGLGPRQPAGRR